MHGHSVDQEGDKPPHFLGIPTPICAPRHVRPDSPDKHADGQQRDGGIQKQARKQGERVGLDVNSRRVTPPYKAQKESRDTTDERQRQQGERHHDDRDVDAEQRRLQHRHDVGYLRVHVIDVRHEQEEARHQQPERHYDAETAADDERKQHDRPRHDEHSLIPVGHGHAPAGHPTQGEAGRKSRQGHYAYRHTGNVCHLRSFPNIPISPIISIPPYHEINGESHQKHARREVDHEQDGGEWHGVVHPLGLNLRARRQRRAAVHLLVFQHLVEDGVNMCDVSGQHFLIDKRKNALHVLAVQAVNSHAVKVVGRRVPRRLAPSRHGEDLQQSAAAQVHDHHQAVVDVGDMLVELVLLPLVILLDVRAEDVSAQHLVEESVDGAVAGQLQRVFQRARLHPDHRLRAPLVAVKYEARQHLLGREPLVTRASV